MEKFNDALQTNKGHRDNANRTEIPLIRLKNIVKRYTGDRAVLDGISFDVNSGEWLAVVGKSGSGKTTLINMIAGLDTPDEGEVLVDGIQIQRMSERNRSLWRGANVGFVFQFFYLLPTLTVLENVLLALDLGSKFVDSARMGRALEILSRLGISHLKDRFPSALSGGEQQRTAIARAIANDPPVLVADEPSGNLDTKTAASVFEIFRGLVDEGKTLLMVTHDPEARQRADRSIVISDGKLIDEIKRNSEAVLR